MTYGVPVWVGGINPRVVEEVWDAQRAFGMSGAEFIPFWKQDAIACSDPQLRVSFWRKPDRLLLAVANFTDRERSAELRLSAKNAAAQFRPAWKAERLQPTKGGVRLSIPAKRGALLFVSLPESRP